MNRTGKSVFIQFAISARNATDEFLAVCDRINQFYPAKMGKEDWQWRTPFKTTTVEISEHFSKEEIFPKLDACLQEILAFEANLARKLNG